MSNVYFGIDLGTSNSSIAYVRGDPRFASAPTVPVDVIRIPTDPEAREKPDRLPTVVAENVGSRGARRPLIGWDVIDTIFRPRRRVELRHGVNLFRSVKSDMGTNRTYPWAFDAGLNTPVKVSAAIIERLVEVARHERRGDPREAEVVVTVPASFAALARRDTLDAVARAGLDPARVHLLDEPVAALIDLLNSGDASIVLSPDRFANVLVFDYGGGTCDLTLVKARYDPTRETGVHVEPLAISQYRRLGGDDVDRAIMADAIWPQIERHLGRSRDALSLQSRTQIEDTLTWTAARRVKERVCQAVAEVVRDDPRGWQRALRMAAQKTDQAPQPVIQELGRKGLPSGYSLSPAELAESMGPFLALPRGDLPTMQQSFPRSLLVPIFETLERAAMSPSELDAIVLHGGSCRNPFVRALLEQQLANADDLFSRTKVVQTPDLDCSVARGAALAAYWIGERRVRVIRPIIPDDIGILTVNDAPLVLLRRGTTLPFPGNDAVHTDPTEFYVARDGQRELLVPIFSGMPERIAGSVKVPMPTGVRMGEIVRINLQVDESKLLRWWFTVGGSSPVEAQSLDDPCTTELPSAAWQAVLDHRRAMREALDLDERLSAEMLVKEAHLLYRSGEEDDDGSRIREAQLAIEDFLERGGADEESLATAWNVKGLILSSQRRFREAAEAYRRACDAGGDHAVYLGNYGTALTELRRIDEAVAAFRSALTKDPTLVYLYQWLARLYRDQGNEAAAVKELEEGLRHATAETTRYPRWRQAWQRRTSLHRALGDYDRAAIAEATLKALRRDEDYRGDSRDMLGVFWRRESP